MHKTRTYRSWNSMKQRCTNPNAHAYELYGGRGITICKQWQSFEQFFSDMGECPEGLTIDRINNNKGYSPNNCRWATYKEQQNNRRDNRLFTYKDKTMTATQWAETVGLTCRQLIRRIDRDWSFEEAINTPMFKPGGKR